MTTTRQGRGAPRPGQKIVLFDGICNLCNASVIFILERDDREIFKFASIQSPAGRALLRRSGYPPDYTDSILLIEDGQAFSRSTAALRILRELQRPWPALGVARMIPLQMRDFLYDWIARNRYLVFGQRDTCMVPTPALSARFL